MVLMGWKHHVVRVIAHPLPPPGWMMSSWPVIPQTSANYCKSGPHPSSPLAALVMSHVSSSNYRFLSSSLTASRTEGAQLRPVHVQLIGQEKLSP